MQRTVKKNNNSEKFCVIHQSKTIKPGRNIRCLYPMSAHRLKFI